MNSIRTVVLCSFLLPSSILFDFKVDTQLNDWRVVNDGVMGGLSGSNLIVNEEGNGVFMVRFHSQITEVLLW